MTQDEFAAWVGYMLKQFGMNQRECGEAIGVQEVQISRWLRRTKPLPLYIGLACAAVVADLAPWRPRGLGKTKPASR
jgi:hypothetical protein